VATAISRRQKGVRRFETRSRPALTRSYPRHFTFYVAHPTRSIQTPSLPTLRRCYLVAFTLITRSPRRPRARNPRCVTVYPRDSPRARVLCLARRSLGEGGSLSPNAPFPRSPRVLCSERRSLGEGWSLIPFARFKRCNGKRQRRFTAGTIFRNLLISLIAIAGHLFRG
jgi:hypothetical protein